ncbi:MAG: thiamine biosynthesis protein ThiF [Eubacteriales bacterium]|nr:thiamine biosynthesis protein ThiF [Eubacteriales bacterium]
MINSMPTEDDIRQALEFRHTKAVQDKLRRAHVAICGLGGLGSAIAIALARTGVGHLHLIDFDCVDLQNINRQQYALTQLGMPKPLALTEEIKRFSPYIDIVVSCERVTEDNCERLLGDALFVCEAFDVAEQKAMLTNYVLEHMPDKYLVGASGMAGYHSGNSIMTKRVTSHYYLCGDRQSEITADYGLMAPRVMICAAHQANTIVELIVKNL